MFARIRLPGLGARSHHPATAPEPDDLNYMSSLSAAILEHTPTRSKWLLWSIVVFVGGMIAWASVAEIDEITRAPGRVIPSSQVQVVQNLEGGIVSEILVHEGDLVERGQVLLKIDDTRFESSFQESRLRYLELLAKQARLAAEAEGREGFDIPEAVAKERPDLARQEQALFRSRAQQLNSAQAIVQQQVAQHRQELAEADSRRKRLATSLALAEQELKIMLPLVKEGAVSDVDILRLKRQVNDLKGDLEAVRLSIPRIRSTIKEMREKRQEIALRFRNEARAELNGVSAELPRLSQSNEALQDKVRRTAVTSPVKGTIKQLFVNTIGGVVQPGMDLVEIVPREDVLVVEARARPADIAYLHPGQKAIVKLTAYDFSIHGGLEGKVVHISADTIADERDESFYLVRVHTAQNHLGDAQHPLPILPGMTAQVDILTGKKTVMDYLLKPLFKVRQEAMRER